MQHQSFLNCGFLTAHQTFIYISKYFLNFFMKKALKNVGIAQFIGLYRKGLKKIGFYMDIGLA